MLQIPERIDVAKSFVLLAGERGANHVEKTLHTLYRDFNLKKEKGDGYTEWFSIECFESVVSFIKQQRILLGYVSFESLSTKQHRTALTVKIDDDLYMKLKKYGIKYRVTSQDVLTQALNVFLTSRDI